MTKRTITVTVAPPLDPITPAQWQKDMPSCLSREDGPIGGRVLGLIESSSDSVGLRRGATPYPHRSGTWLPQHHIRSPLMGTIALPLYLTANGLGHAIITPAADETEEASLSPLLGLVVLDWLRRFE